MIDNIFILDSNYIVDELGRVQTSAVLGSRKGHQNCDLANPTVYEV